MQIVKKAFPGLCWNPIFLLIRFLLSAIWKVTLSFPQREEASPGVYPLDPPLFQRVSMKITFFRYVMGVETPIPPIMMNAAAPEGTPPRRFRAV
jgi:hypothetical protein